MNIEGFQLDYTQVVKALTGEQPAPAAPAAAAGSQPQPSGPDAQPRSGHKYVKRWWDGGKWQYEYPGETAGQHHGAAHFGDHQKREHTVELPEGHQFGPGQEEHAYRSAMQEHFKPGAKHAAPHPHPKRANEQISVRVLPSGKLRVTDAAGQKVQNRDFDSHGAYEGWARGQQLEPETYPDHMGRPMLNVVPVVGNVEGGVLQPLDTAAANQRSWRVVPHRDADQELVAPALDKRKEVGRYFSKQQAQAAVAEKLRFLEQVKGVQFPRGTPAAPPQSAPEQAAVAQVAAAPAVAQQAAPQQIQAALSPEQEVEVLRNAKDPIMNEMANYGWQETPDPATRGLARKLNAPPEVKERMVQKVAMGFSPLIRKIVNKLASNIYAGDEKAKSAWMERLFGDVLPENLSDEHMVPFSPEPGSFIHDRIGAILDNYKPGKSNFARYAQANLEKDFMKYAQDTAYNEGNGPRGGGSTKLFNESLNPADTVRPEVLEAPTHAPRRDKKPVAPGEAPESYSARPTGGTAEGAFGDEEEGGHAKLSDWRRDQISNIEKLAREKNFAPNFTSAFIDAVNRISDNSHIERFMDFMEQRGYGDYIINKSLMRLLAMMAKDLQKAQATTASPFLTKDKHVDPMHQYAHMEGDDDHPRYYFKDAKGNFIRYTNAPAGHSDASKRLGDAKVHPAEPLAAQAPQFYDPQGRKLTRAPYPGAQVEWNPKYHQHDPENMWIGRWVNPVTGEHEHTYVDADMRMVPKLYIHQSNALVDVRLPVLRKYIRSLFSSPYLKDRITATAAALIDQGRFSAEELTVLTPSDVMDLGAIFKIGNRFIYADGKLRSILQLMIKNRGGAEPLFAVPMMKKNGEVDPSILRRIGPHYLQCLFDQVGVSLPSLRTYHATQTFSKEVQRLIVDYQAPWQSAIEYATVAVAQEMGHDLSHEPDMEQALPLLRDLLIDPVVIEVLQRNAEKLSLTGQMATMLPLPPPAVMYVSLDLVTRTAEEEEFSKWLHAYPVHMHAEVQNFVAPQRPVQMVPNKANVPDAQPPQPEADPNAQPAQAAS